MASLVIASSSLASVVGWSCSRLDRFAVLKQADVATRMAASLEAEVEGLPARLEAHAKGRVSLSPSAIILPRTLECKLNRSPRPRSQPLLPEEDGPDFAHVEHCLTVLENLVVRFPDVQQMIEQTRPILARLLGTLLVVSLSRSTIEDADDDESSAPSVSLMSESSLQSRSIERGGCPSDLARLSSTQGSTRSRQRSAYSST